jgi:hypothetical protein
MARTNLDFPDPITRPAPAAQPRPISGLLTPAPAGGSLAADPLSELRKQTELLKFMAGWLLAVSLLMVMGLVIGLGLAATYLLVAFGPFELGLALLGFVILMLVTVATVSFLRNSIFRILKIRA